MEFSTLRRRVIAAALLTTLVLAVAPASAAGRHRARLSTDLADALTAGSPDLDVIVHGTRAEIEALAARYNLRVRRLLRSGAVLRLTAGQLDALQQDEAVDHLSSDLPIRSTADVTVVSIGADQVWAGSHGLPPLSGAGIGVAVVDSGVDAGHPALRGRVVASVDFTGGDGRDGFGHGTHVAALIAGGGGRSATTAVYRGIASGAHIVSLRVLDDRGAGMASNVIEAIDWAIAHRQAHNIRVINLSLGAPVVQPYRDDPLCEAVERAVAAGLVVVVAAGNYGRTADGRPLHGGVMSPGNAPHAITVGALDGRGTAERSDDVVAGYSSKGPTLFDLVLKPDLTAPGTRVVSAAADGSYLARTYPERVVAGESEDRYLALSGTSMSAGVVSGAVALLLVRRPALTADEARLVLQASASFVPAAGLVAAGAGSLNVLSAAAMLDGPEGWRLLRRGVRIASEPVRPSGLAWFGRSWPGGAAGFAPALRTRFVVKDGTLRVRASGGPPLPGDTVIWGNTALDTVVWGTSVSQIVWGSNDTVVWGGSVETVLWGNAATLSGADLP
jgi:serine protease AprX